jgi:hypothetical protein
MQWRKFITNFMPRPSQNLIPAMISPPVIFIFAVSAVILFGVRYPKTAPCVGQRKKFFAV